MELIFATSNFHKVEEIQSALPKGYSVKSLADIGYTDELPETTGTISGNSLQKAQTLFEAIGIPCFSEDTGLEIDALDGRPGVYSARYAGANADSVANIQKVLHEMEDISHRSAQFRTVITFYTESGYKQFVGICIGEILLSPRGAAGFGYDSIFLPTGCNQSFAEMRLIDKYAISHRKKAMDLFLYDLTTTTQSTVNPA